MKPAEGVGEKRRRAESLVEQLNAGVARLHELGIELKSIDWAGVSEQFREEAKSVRTDQEHLVLLVRLLARLKDGHAGVRPLEKGKDVKWPDEPPRTGPESCTATFRHRT